MATVTPVPPRDEGLAERVVTVVENQRGIDYENLFAAYLKGARRIEIVAPFIRTFYQARNLMEFLEMVLRFKNPEDEIQIDLRTGGDEFNGESQKNYLEQIRESCEAEGIVFTFSFSDKLHDRSIKTDTGWFITLGRGLDIYQPCDLKNTFLFTSRVPAQRKCKPFTVSYNHISTH